MKIFVYNNKIICKQKTEQDIEKDILNLDIGSDDIAHIGTTLVDHIVLDILNNIKHNEEITLYSNGEIEAKMIARKLEDKIKKEINIFQNKI